MLNAPSPSVVFLKARRAEKQLFSGARARESKTNGDRIAVSKREPVVDPALEKPLLKLHRTMDVNSFWRATQQLLATGDIESRDRSDASTKSGLAHCRKMDATGVPRSLRGRTSQESRRRADAQEVGASG